MSPHGRHYYPVSDGLERPKIFGWIGATISIATAGILAAIFIALTEPAKPDAVEAVITPVRTPTVVITDLQPLDRETARALGRIDGFRLGYATALERGCAIPAMTAPIAAQ